MKQKLAKEIKKRAKEIKARQRNQSMPRKEKCA